MNIGTQYKLDDEFKAIARLFQSKYRAEVLGVEFEDYGNRLTDSDAQALLNYYGKVNCKEVLRKRYPFYSKKRDADLLRSEHIPFNLIAPLDADREAAREIISTAWGIQCKEILSVEMEYAPSPKEEYLNDGTAFDTYIKAQLKDGRTCGIGIEVKYTEQDYPVGVTEKKRVQDHHSLYWTTARASCCFRNSDDEIFGTDQFRQVWRNHLLGLSMIQHSDIDLFFSVTLFPDGNTHFHKVIPRYKSLLTEHAQAYVIGSTFEQFISAIEGPTDFLEWKNWLERRYVIK